MSFIAKGIFTWEGAERRSQRYGSFTIDKTNFDRDSTARVMVDLPALRSLVGKRVHVTLKVIASRKSGHAGDRLIKVMPVQPADGETIDLGVGILSLTDNEWSSIGYDVVIQPLDGRDFFWLNPTELYKAHDQTVGVTIVETTEEPHPIPNFETAGGAIANDGDTFQVATPGVFRKGGMVRVAHRIESLGDGLFTVRSIGEGTGVHKVEVLD